MRPDLPQRGGEPPVDPAASAVPVGGTKKRLVLDVLAVHVPRRAGRQATVAAFRPPRSILVSPFVPSDERGIARAAAVIASPGATVVCELLSGPKGVVLFQRTAARLQAILPGSEVFGYVPDEILRFLWYFRDHHELQSLGSAAERLLLDSTYPSTKVPRFRKAEGRGKRRRAVEEVRALVLDIGAALGVRPFVPVPGDGATGFGVDRVTDVIDATLGLYAALLHRWGSPLARVRDRTPEIRVLGLADRYLRARSG